MNVSLLRERDVKRIIDRESNRINDALSYDGSLILPSGMLVDNIIQKYISDNKCDDYKIIKPFIIDAVARSEHGAGGSGPICLNLISHQLSATSNRIRAGYKNDQIKNDQKIQISKIISSINKSARKLNKADVYRLIDRNFSLAVQKKIFQIIIDKSNIKSHIFLERSNRRDTILSFFQGFNFELSVDSEMIPSNGIWERRNVKVLVIDGMIESIGEIHHVLERAASEKNPIVMFVRSMADDVRSTLALNIKRGTIDLIPVEVGFNEETINILNDISICCNSDIISTHMGDLISTSGTIELSSVKKITISSKGINIVNDAQTVILNSHLKYLEEKRNISTSSEVHDMFDKRVRSLSSGKILIDVGNDLLSLDPQTIEKFDKLFREMRALVTHGVIYKSSVELDSLKLCLEDDYPYSSSAIFFAAKYALSSINNILSISCALIEDNI